VGSDTVTALATVALAVLAAVTAWYARRAWLAQKADLADQVRVSAKQVPVLDAQLAELQAAARQREADTRERRERFVSGVFIWRETETRPGTAGLSEAGVAVSAPAATADQRRRAIRTWVRNTGPVPVYDVGFAWQAANINGVAVWQQLARPLMPSSGDSPVESTTSWPWAIADDFDPETAQVAVFIRDAVGACWRLRPGGHYEEYAEGMLPPGLWKTT
jgi:hypothetical protein